ncbi:DUF4393 domain-containing protein [Natronomonas marina]|jgi:hypothetical protein|uniref:DUF4393 domain-containing protein n=1 Tax=Natronomonas marina TaxID=2961939 RepID=UPI0020C9BD38|nr:DUF4393 domain-containing protein [Natronomonas marina]
MSEGPDASDPSDGSRADPDDGRDTPATDDGPDDDRPEAPDVDAEAEPDIPPEEVDRVFSVMDEAVTNDAVEGSQVERLLSVLERALASPSETNPETLAELVSILEEIVLDPDDLEEVNVDGLLGVLEEAVSGATAADSENLRDVFGVLEEGFTDPTSLDPKDIERFRSGLEGAIVDLTDPAGGNLGGFFPIPGLTGVDPEDVDPDGDGDAMDMFRIARVATAMTQRATGYSMESGIRTGTRMAYAAATAESPADLLTETRAITLDELQRAGIDIGDEQSDWLEAHEEEIADRRPLTAERLRERGERLLSKSAEVGRDESLHPAYPSILDELAADEARILRLLATDGTQAYMDVRDRGYIPFRSRLVAEHMTMVGADAGCRLPERTPIYLQNLERLGLITFSEDPIDDLKRYQVLEAQPHIEAARESAKRPKTVYGSLYLTDLGVDFCDTCLPVSVDFERSRARFRRESGE